MVRLASDSHKNDRQRLFVTYSSNASASGDRLAIPLESSSVASGDLLASPPVSLSLSLSLAKNLVRNFTEKTLNKNCMWADRCARICHDKQEQAAAALPSRPRAKIKVAPHRPQPVCKHGTLEKRRLLVEALRFMLFGLGTACPREQVR